MSFYCNMDLPLRTEALVVSKPGGSFEMTPIQLQDLRPDEILVEMKYSGVCHTVSISPSHRFGGTRHKGLCVTCRTSSSKRVLWQGSSTTQPLQATRALGSSRLSAQRSRTSLSNSATPSSYLLLPVAAVDPALTTNSVDAPSSLTSTSAESGVRTGLRPPS